MNDTQSKLQSLSDNGTYHILAFDHRGSFKKMMQQHAEAPVTDQDAIALKKDIINPLKDIISGVLIDQDYGVPAYKELGATAPFLLPTEKTGYIDTAGERITELEYTGASIVELGAKAMKILIYANKNVPTWHQQMETCKKAYDDAHANGLPLFLEFVLYNVGETTSGTINEVLKDALDNGVKADVWKIPYPGSEEMCKETSEVVGTTPWVLLTGGTTFEEFLAQYKIAKAAGASGFVAGRALWQEACTVWQKPEELNTFLNVELVRRFNALKAV
jgi:tagatose 1,6-diphosphate aldolase